MTLFTLTDSSMLQVVMWGLGIFSTIFLTLLIHIGNAGSQLKKDNSNLSERIAHVETQTQNTAKDIVDIKLDLRELIKRK